MHFHTKTAIVGFSVIVYVHIAYITAQSDLGML